MNWNLGAIDGNLGKPKYLQIADRVWEAVISKTLKLGDRLPSINEVILALGVSRDTAVKAYNELKRRGIIEATPNKAFFIAKLSYNFQKRILFIADSMTPYKEALYYGLIDGLGSDYFVDFTVHSDDFDILKTIYERSRDHGMHEAYLIIPTAGQAYEHDYFRLNRAGNILFLDRSVPGLHYPAVHQDFTQSFVTAFKSQSPRLAAYRELVFLLKTFTNPIVEQMKDGLGQAAKAAGIGFSVETTLFSDSQIDLTVRPGACYSVLHPNLVYLLLQAAGRQNLKAGKDFGLIAINDEPAFPFIEGGISALSCDFPAMGRAAAEFVKLQHSKDIVVPTRLILRNTF